jgi:hypothetical protein
MGANSPEAFWRSGEPQKTTAIPHSLTKAVIKRQNCNAGENFFALCVRGKPAPFAFCPIGQGICSYPSTRIIYLGRRAAAAG